MTSKQTFADRLRACMTRLNYKQRFVAEQVGVSQPAVAKWIAGDTRKVQADVLFRLADLFNVNPRWLSDGQGEPWVSPADDWIHEMTDEGGAEAPEGDPLLQGGKKKAPGRPKIPNPTMRLGLDVPEEAGDPGEKKEEEAQGVKSAKESRCALYACVQTAVLKRGRTSLSPVLAPSKERIDAVIPKSDLGGLAAKDCRQIVVRTDAMAPAICPGDAAIVGVSGGGELVSGAVYCLYWPTESTLARVMKDPDGSVLIQFDNPAYPAKKLSSKEFSAGIHVVGRVIIRSGSRFASRGLFI